MTEFKIKAAGRTAAVSALYDSTKAYCREYLTEDAPDFSVAITPADIEFERMKSARENELEGLPPHLHSNSYLETTAVQRKITEKLFAYDVLLFHGSVVAVDGAAYLFTAKSGTGKSTHTRLWRELLGERAVMVNDDKPFLRMTQEGVFACGSPWKGKHRLGADLCVPLKAICILERGEENRICPVDAKDAIHMLFQQSSRPMDRRNMPKYMDLLDKLAENVAFYRMACNMNEEAAEMAYGVMSGTRKED